jgi:tripartite motif-containing protein 71
VSTSLAECAEVKALDHNVLVAQPVRTFIALIAVILGARCMTTTHETGGFLGPAGVRCHPDGRRFVVDDLAHRIAVLPVTGQPRMLGQPGSRRGQLSYPDAVHWRRDGHLVIADTGANRIQVWTPEGRFVSEFGRPPRIWRAARRVIGTRAAQRFIAVELLNPRDVWVGDEDTIFVADTGGDVVRVFEAGGTLLRTIGRAGSKPGELRQPLGLTTDRTGRLLVADSGNNRLQVFTAGGEFVEVIGGPGVEPGAFDAPHGVALDADGRVLVSDRGNQRVQVLDSDGRPLLVVDRAPDGSRFTPAGLCVDAAGALVVADTAGHRVLEWSAAWLQRALGGG